MSKQSQAKIAQGWEKKFEWPSCGKCIYFQLFAIPGQSEIIGAPQNKKARVVRAKTEEK